MAKRIYRDEKGHFINESAYHSIRAAGGNAKAYNVEIEDGKWKEVNEVEIDRTIIGGGDEPWDEPWDEPDEPDLTDEQIAELDYLDTWFGEEDTREENGVIGAVSSGVEDGQGHFAILHPGSPLLGLGRRRTFLTLDDAVNWINNIFPGGGASGGGSVTFGIVDYGGYYQVSEVELWL